MKTRSLRSQISSFVGLVLLAASIAILISVWVVTLRHAQNQVDADLAVGDRVFNEVMAARERQLINSAEVLTADFGFRQAVASRDSGTIKSALDNHAQRIKADLMAIVDLDGDIVAATSARLLSAELPGLGGLVDASLSQGGSATFIELNGTLYQTFLLPVRAPTPIAVALVGFGVDAALAGSLGEITGLDISFVSIGDKGPALIVSTLDDNTVAGIVAAKDDKKRLRLPFQNRPLYQSITLPLEQGKQTALQATLTDDLNSVFEEFDLLQLEIAIIALLSLAAALLASLVLARRLTRPLSQLAGTAMQIAEGDYQTAPAIAGNTKELRELETAVGIMRKRIRRREEQILYQAGHDILTGLISRDELSATVRAWIAEGQPFHLVGVSISNFREINDMFGPDVGDACLINIASFLHNENLLAARLDLGSFAVFRPGPINEIDAVVLSKKMRASRDIHAVDIMLEMHTGLVAYPEHAEDHICMLRRLEIALDSARSAPYGLHSYRHGQEEDYVLRLQLVEDLRKATGPQGSGLQMVYQPKLNLLSGACDRLEALVRWQHPKHGRIAPDLFVPLAEQSGLINRLTEWIIGDVLRQLADWQAQGLRLHVAINLSAKDLALPGILDFIARRRREFDVSSQAIGFEITESELMENPEQAIELLQGFRDAGYTLALDDFGTGYSSLSQLKKLPISELKIDRHFVAHLTRDIDDQKIVRSTLALAECFNLSVVAEGIEDRETLELLRSWGVQWAQGYVISAPRSAEDLVLWLQEQNRREQYQRESL